MRLGGFGNIKDYYNMRNTGFDYAELDVPELEGMPENDFRIFCDEVHESRFPVLTGARAIPVMKPWFFTDAFHLTDYKEYLEQACRRAGQLGMKKLILGNGKARRLIQEDSINKEKNFIDFMRMFAEIAGEFGQDVILEPLGPQYTNYINTLPEAVRVIQEVNMPNLFTMIDLRHMFWAEESFDDIETFAESVRHIHLDYPRSYPQRRFPKMSDDYDYTAFLKAIRKSGYNDTLTVEADIPEDWRTAYNDISVFFSC